MPPESPTLGLSHLEFEAMISASRGSANINDYALVAMLGLLGLRVFEATGSDITALGEARGHRVLKVHGKGDKVALVPLRTCRRTVDRATESRHAGPILLNVAGNRMDRHAATRRLRALALDAGVATVRMHPHIDERVTVSLGWQRASGLADRRLPLSKQEGLDPLAALRGRLLLTPAYPTSRLVCIELPGALTAAPTVAGSQRPRVARRPH